ncbi:hypothetical protein RJZ90_007861, partial [Blastomyces dermatitidis]
FPRLDETYSFVVVAADNQTVAADRAAFHSSASSSEGAFRGAAEGSARRAGDSLEDWAIGACWTCWARWATAGGGSNAGGEQSDDGDEVGELHFCGLGVFD